jgi:hypothetical protein
MSKPVGDEDKQRIRILTRQILTFVYSDECDDWSDKSGTVIISALAGALVSMMGRTQHIPPPDAITACKELFQRNDVTWESAKQEQRT